MESPSPTASTVVGFAERLEERSKSFYDELSERFPSHAAFFESCARESKLNKVLLTRTYQETVTDALETGFSFEGLVLTDAIPERLWQGSKDIATAFDSALTLERAAVDFYTDISNRSEALLSTIHTAFAKIRTVRDARLAKLEAERATP